MNETVVSMNGIINQMQYYGEEFVRYHIVESIVTIIVGLIFLIITTIGIWLLFKKMDDLDVSIGGIYFIIIIATATISIISLLIGWYNYIIWKTVPVGAAVQQILDVRK